MEEAINPEVVYGDMPLETDEISGNSDISGSGGGKGGKGKSSGVSAPKEANVSLQSAAFVTALFLLSEGEIEGSADVDLAKSIYINETVLKNNDNTTNFTNVWADIRRGTAAQTLIPLTGGNVASNQNINTQIKQATPITRTISNGNATGFSVVVSTPTLRTITDKEIKGATIRYRVEVQPSGQAYQLAFEDEITGYTPTGYERTIERPLPGSAPWNIRMTRITADSISSSLNNDLYWNSLATITEARLTYPYSALLAVKIGADQFSSIPKFAVELKGRKILVPHNYNPVTRVYTGDFNGTLLPGYSDNPAWCFYDMATNNRYGLGKYVAEASVDKYALYHIGRYCDELIPNGKGGMEPRFTCNIYIKDAEEAAQVLSDLAAVFRGMTYYSGGTVVAVQDRPRDPARIFNESNVLQSTDEQGRITEPTFRYSGTAQRAIHTAAIVYWQDPKDFYRTVPEYVDEPTQIARFGFNPTEVRALGCTSQGQARRVGEWILASERYRTQTVSFKVPAEGLLMRPNEVIKIYDPLKMGFRRGGRITSATATSLTIDAPFEVAANRIWTVHFMNPGGLMEVRQINNTPGTTTNVLTWSAAQALAADRVPMPNQPWAIESNALSSTLWQVMSIAPLEGETYEVVAIEYDGGIYDYVDRQQPIPDRVTTNFDDPRKPPQAPSALYIAQSLYETNGASGLKTRLDVSWQVAPGTTGRYYNIQWRGVGDNTWNNNARTDQNTYSLYDVPYGSYEFRVRTETQLGNVSSWVYAIYANTGLTDPPLRPTGLTLDLLDANSGFLHWDLSPDLDVRVGGSYRIKHSRKNEFATWSDGQDVARVAGSTTNVTVPLRSGTYLMKAVDSSGFESIDATSVTVANLPEVFNLNAVHTLNDQAGGYPGTFNNIVNYDGVLRLPAASGYFDQASGNFIDATGNFDDKGGIITISSPGTYTFRNAVDLTDIFSCILTVNMDASVIDENQLFDQRAGEFDRASGEFDGNIPTGATATVLVATSLNGVDYNDYAPITTSEYRARSFKFKLVLDKGDTNFNIEVYSLSIVIDMPDRVESNTVVILAQTTTVNFANKFNNVPAVGATIQNGLPGDYLTIDNITQRGFNVTIKNNLNQIVERRISWIAKGYGI